MELQKLYHASGMSASPIAPEKIRHPDVASIDLATVMRTVGDPVRLAIVRLLRDGGEQTCGDLQAALSIPASTGSYHLRLLREAGVTRTRADGTLRLISLRSEDLEARFPGLVDVLTRS
jgi:DNA-binding transcriptional ArsR family regulator